MNLRFTLQLKCLDQLPKSILMKTICHVLYSYIHRFGIWVKKVRITSKYYCKLEHFSFHVVWPVYSLRGKSALYFTFSKHKMPTRTPERKRPLSRAKRKWKWLKSRNDCIIWWGECNTRTCANSPRLLLRSVFTMETQSPLRIGLWRHWQIKVYFICCNLVTKKTMENLDVMSFTNQDKSNL